MAAIYSPMLHNGGRNLTYDANGPLPPGHPGAPFQGVQQGGGDDWGPSDGGCTVPRDSQGQAHLQQKMTMMRQRQLAIERQRNAARTRLGASVVAQANPLVPQAPKLESNTVKWSSLGIEGGGPTLSNIAEMSKVVASAEGRAASPSVAAPDTPKDQQTPSQRGGAKLKDEFDDVEELADNSMSGLNRNVADDEEIKKALKKGRKERLAAQRAARDAVLGGSGGNTVDAVASVSPTSDAKNEAAWGGGGGLVAQQPPPRPVGDSVEEFSIGGPGEMPMRGPRDGGRIGRRGDRRGTTDSGDSVNKTSGATWSLDVDRAPEPATDDKKEKSSWWRWGGENGNAKKNGKSAGDAVEKTEVTPVLMMND